MPGVGNGGIIAASGTQSRLGETLLENMHSSAAMVKKEERVSRELGHEGKFSHCTS